MAVITTWGAILENVSDHYLAVITTWGAILENVCGSDHYLGSDIRECLAVITTCGAILDVCQ